MRVLVLGANGMLGHAVLRILAENDRLDVYGTVRSKQVKKYFQPQVAEKLIPDCDVLDDGSLNGALNKVQPDVVVNCISISKQQLSDADPLLMVPVYALLPHRLAHFCAGTGARYIHISTDGVFSGDRGGYLEDDHPDARDIYGLAKYLGEVHSSHTISIRTSIIGHELRGNNGLVEWFLSQEGQCTCFSRAIFSGFPTIVLAQIIRDIIIPREDLTGVYHVASKPISKCDLLRLIAEVYGKSIKIIDNDQVVMDRSLNADHFQSETGYTPPEWPDMINKMYSYK